jgi:hypothetical protein
VQQRIVIGIFLTSIVVALITLFFGHETSAQYAAAPALILSGLVALGHLVTLDDDAPGEWSNSEVSSEIWRHSLIELAIKLIVFAAVGVIFYV